MVKRKGAPAPIEPISIVKKFGKKKVAVLGGGGFIGSHIAKRLFDEGHYVIVSDWARNTYFKENEFCNEFKLLDLRTLEACNEAVKGVDWVFNLAADMGGMGFIQSNEATLMYNNTMISMNATEASRKAGVERVFYASSACVYPEELQNEAKDPGLREDTAWPAHPQDSYGLEKLFAEEACKHFGNDFPKTKYFVGRFHNIYGPRGTWKGGREKVPAAFCRKALTSTKEFEVWGDGKQTRSFCFVDDCVEAVLRLISSDFHEPLNIGSEEMVSMNELADLAMSFGDKKLPINHIKGPEGVRGRNSDNDLCRKVLKWEPQIDLATGLRRTYDWIKGELAAETASGVDTASYGTSKVYQLKTPDEVSDKVS